jgi:hypothetical protein
VLYVEVLKQRKEIRPEGELPKKIRNIKYSVFLLPFFFKLIDVNEVVSKYYFSLIMQ